jgi:HEAT repeat protein
MPRPQTPAGWADQLQSGDQFARAEAAGELGRLGKEGFGYLYQGMQSGSWETRLACLRAAPREEIVRRPGELVPLLTQLLNDSQPEVQKYAAVRLGWFGAGAQSAFPVLKKMLAQADDPQIKQEVMEAILAIHDSPALLAPLLRDPDPFLRKSVATRLAGMALHGIPIDAAGPALRAALEKESNPEIQVIAREALEQMRRGRK